MSRFTIERSPNAERDLTNIWRHIAADNPAAATAVLSRIDRKIEGLRQYPRVGRARPEIRAGLRGILAGRYVVL